MGVRSSACHLAAKKINQAGLNYDQGMNETVRWVMRAHSMWGSHLTSSHGSHSASPHGSTLGQPLLVGGGHTCTAASAGLKLLQPDARQEQKNHSYMLSLSITKCLPACSHNSGAFMPQPLPPPAGCLLRCWPAITSAAPCCPAAMQQAHPRYSLYRHHTPRLTAI